MRDIFLALTAALAWLCEAAGSSHEVSVRMEATWPSHAHSAIMEAAEFAGAERFWEFMDTAWSEQDREDGTACAVRTAQKNMDEHSVKLLRAALDLGAFSPAVEQQRQLCVALWESLHGGSQTAASLPVAWAAFGGDGQPASWTSDPTRAAELVELQVRRAASSSSSTQALNSFLNPFHINQADHVFGNAPRDPKASPAVVILHGTLGSDAFAALHAAIKVAVAKHSGSARYVVRFCPSSADPLTRPRTALQGFGATMDIKNMEYLTIDTDAKKGAAQGQDAEIQGGASSESSQADITQPVLGISFAKLIARNPSAEKELRALHADMLRESELETSNEVEQIKVWDLADIGKQAAARVMSSAEPLRTWADLAGNLPSRARQLIKSKVPEDLAELAERLGQSDIPDSAVTINGMRVDMSGESFNIFEVLDLLRKDAQVSSAAASVELGRACEAKPAIALVREATSQLASIEQNGGSSGSSDSQGVDLLKSSGKVRVNVRANAKGAVLFLNNLEKDSFYSRWPQDLQYLLQRSQQIIPIRRNLYTIIAVLDLATREDREALSELFDLVKQGLPARVGVALAPRSTKAVQEESCDSLCFASLLHIAGESGAEVAKVLQALARIPGDSVYVADAVSAYANAVAGRGGLEQVTAAATEAVDAERGSELMQRMENYVEGLGLPRPSWTLNGALHVDLGPGLRNELLGSLAHEQRAMQFLAYTGEIDASTDYLTFVLKATDAIQRFNVAVAQTTSGSSFATRLPAPTLAVPYLFDGTTETKTPVAVTVWLLLGLGQHRSRDLTQLLTFASSAPAGVRIAVLPRSVLALHEPSGETFWSMVASGASAAELRQALEGDGKTNEASGGKTSALEALAAQVEELLPGLGSALLFNGRIIELGEGVRMLAKDIEFAVDTERTLRAKAVAKVIRTACPGADASQLSEWGMRISAVAGAANKVKRHDIPYQLFHKPYSELVLDTGEDDITAQLDIRAVMSPIEENAPRVSAVLAYLHEALGARVRVLLKPPLNVQKFPIPSYFRFAAGSHGVVRFTDMPQKQLLTLKISTPEPWIVYASHTEGSDTDNLLLGALPKRDTLIQYELAALLVTGHCEDASPGSSGAPPAGLQLQLGTQGAVRSDTLVMRNLGYWQLQAAPGMWRLALAPGPSSELYAFDDGAGGATGREKPVLVRDFVLPPHRLPVRKRPGKENEQLMDSLDDGKPQPSPVENVAQALGLSFVGRMVSWVKSIVFGTTADASAKAVSASNETIHVFSLASGALYERFLRIMMVTAHKRSSKHLKYWVVENFLSPEFKKSIPHLSRHYGFDYALVTYKWPHWLRRQTEKQRIIWGYKILFLDVLFPLDVPKIIYIDSDQVVRADVDELWQLDMHGKPYAYTPFCTSRKETLGYQFWRQGFWEQHLRGKPYHISALYVVDLIKFRKMMVGDRLRAIYDQLSRDPNSLSNLDQDLPNYAQHMVPIHSLPQEWLWCESWCSDESKAASKTIDLCNNPQHKEPKLEMAKRVISGKLFPQSWIELDEEIKQVLASPQGIPLEKPPSEKLEL